MFQLNPVEKAKAVANCDHLSNLKFSKALPLVFTEHGAIMAANVVNSSRAIEMGVFVVRVFVGLRRNIESHRELAGRLSQLERRFTGHDEQLVSIIKAINSLLSTKEIPNKRRIGFSSEDP